MGGQGTAVSSHPTISSPSHARSLCLSCFLSLSVCLAFFPFLCFLYICCPIHHFFSFSCTLSLSVLLSPSLFVFSKFIICCLIHHIFFFSCTLSLSVLLSFSICLAFSLFVCFLYHLLSHPIISSPSHARSLYLSCFRSLSVCLVSPSLVVSLHLSSVVPSNHFLSFSCTLSLSVLLFFSICLYCFLPHCLFSLNLSSVVPSITSSPSHARSLCLSVLLSFSICLSRFLPHCLFSLHLSSAVPSNHFLSFSCTLSLSVLHSFSICLSCFSLFACFLYTFYLLFYPSL
jgi:hypothetical protein